MMQRVTHIELHNLAEADAALLMGVITKQAYDAAVNYALVDVYRQKHRAVGGVTMSATVDFALLPPDEMAGLQREVSSSNWPIPVDARLTEGK